MAKIYKDPNGLVQNEYDEDYERSYGPDRTQLLNKLEFEKFDDKKLLNHFLKSSGWGFTGSQKDGKFTIKGPEWDKSWNPMSRQQIIDELNERKRIDLEDDGDWFEYIESLEDL